MSQTYRHTQPATLVLVLIGAAVLFEAWLLTRVGAQAFVLVAIGLSAAVMILFSSLTVRIEDGLLRCSFGPGWIGRTFDLRSVSGARAVRNRWFMGWGIRWIGRGWMFNVSGFDAVEIDLPQGRIFRIGTDEPEALARAIRQSIQLTR